MASKYIFYYYATDPNSKFVEVALPPEDITKPNYSSLHYNTIALYDNNFKQVGVLTRYFSDIFSQNSSEDFYSIDNWTIWFNNNSDSINFNANEIVSDDSPYFIPNVPINSIITNCSGSIWNKKGTVEFLPLDNKVKSRIITVTLY